MDQVFTPSPPISNRVKCHKIFDDLYDFSLVCHEFHIVLRNFVDIMKLSVGGGSSLMINNSAPYLHAPCSFLSGTLQTILS
jgi:hypothetical protein